MINRIHIIGVIGDSAFVGEDEAYVTFKDVVRQVESRREATALEVFINSPGGVVEEGDAIYDYLLSLDIPVTTIATNECASIATKIFLAGTDRLIHPDCYFMIHNPFGMNIGDAKKMDDYAEDLRKTETAMAKLYAERTGTSESAIREFMRTETELSAEEAIDLNFATDIYQTAVETKPVAYFRAQKPLKEKSTKRTKMANKKKPTGFLAKLAQMVAAHIEGITLTAAAGPEGAASLELVFPEVEEGAEPQINDTATVEGSPAEGDFTMPNESVYRFQGGVLMEIIPAESEEEEEEEEPTGDEALEALQAQVDELTEANTALEGNYQELETKYNALKKDLKQLNALRAGYKPGKTKGKVEANGKKPGAPKSRITMSMEDL